MTKRPEGINNSLGRDMNKTMRENQNLGKLSITKDRRSFKLSPIAALNSEMPSFIENLKINIDK